MTFDSLGRLILFGWERSALTRSLGSFALRLRPEEWSEPAPVQVRLAAPRNGDVISLNSTNPSSFRAMVLGATNRVDWVGFYDGRRLLGVVTNEPFEFGWSRPSRGVHRIKAVAKVGGSEVSSCASVVSVTSPRNDHFAARTKLKGVSVNVVSDNLGATRESPLDNTSYSEASVWYSWQAPGDGVYELSVTDLSTMSYSSLELTVHAGSSADGMTRVQRVTGTQVVDMKLKVQRGETFQIRVATYSEHETRFRLRLQRVAPPSNDELAAAKVLEGANVSTAVDLSGATSEPGEWHVSEPLHTNYAGTASVWYSWAAPSSGLFLASVAGSGVLPDVRCYTGDSFVNLDSVGQTVYGETNGVALYAVRRTRYLFKLAGAEAKTVRFSISPFVPPANDQFANRQLIPPGAHTASGSMIGATFEPFEGNRAGGSVWFAWTAPANGVYSALVTPYYTPSTSRTAVPAPGSPWSSVQVYQGDGGTGPTNVISLDYLTPSHFRARAGEQYQIAVSGGHARFRLDLIPVPIPANDNFAEAAVLDGSFVFVGGTTAGAGLEPLEPSHLGYLGGAVDRTVWYRWTAPSNGLFRFAASGTFLELYRGGTLTEVERVTNGMERLLVTVEEGTAYKLALVGGTDFALSISPVRRPANDDFANRQPVVGARAEFTGNLRNATVEEGEPGPNGYSLLGRSVWYTWTAPADGVYSLRSEDYYFYSAAPVFTVFSGDVLTNLAQIGTSYLRYPSGMFEFPAEAGAVYQFSMGGGFTSDDSRPDRFRVELAPVLAPVNDHFENRLSLAGAEVSITASNNGASIEVGEPRIGSYSGGQTVWWKWRAPHTGRFTFEASGFLVGVFAGSTLDDLTLLADNTGENGAVNIPVEAGEEYQIVVDRRDYQSPRELNLIIRQTGSPPNDDFASRLQFTNSATFTLEGGSIQPDEPAVPFGSGKSSVWWTWASPSNGTYRFKIEQLSDAYASFPRVEIFTGGSLSELESVVNDLGYASSLIHVPVMAGTTYFVRITGQPGNSGSYSLSSTYVPPPANDAFANRIAVPAPGTWIIGSNLTATAEIGEPPFGSLNVPARRSVWWSWTAATNGQVQIVRDDFARYQRISVYTGETLGELQLVAAGPSWSGSLQFDAVAGTTYQVSFDTPSWNGYGTDWFAWAVADTTSVLPLPPSHYGGRIPPLPPTPLPPTTLLPDPEPSVIETSTNLIDWLPLTNSTARFRLAPSTNEPMRFFRFR